ncbi:DUF3592 domain-containing protein [Hamadaea tsunoensis]|uniref:DUF3592 domain-containing protein n=1 Tax=Hamadaea tsunoensis TaxID=53368 RepID=UPI000480F918|nr:DUF3592 domain-containing protein [Hamadaea tsunoensis]
MAIVWAVVALFLLSIGLKRLLRSLRLHGGHESPGTIVESQFRSGHLGRVRYRPVIVYRAANGQRVRVLGPVRRRSAYPRGAAVIVRYRPERPDRVEVVDGPGEGTAAAGHLFTGTLLLVTLVVFAIALG